MCVAIVDYGSGNLHSAAKAFAFAAGQAGIDQQITVTDDPSVVLKADRIVLPGVGAFAQCRAGLMAVDGMAEALNEAVITEAKPFFGICVGMQLMATRGLEKTQSEGLNWIGGDVVEIKPEDSSLPVPHMGWNTIDLDRSHPLFDGIKTGPDGLHAYFVHSYHYRTKDAAQRIATADYGGPITATIARDNLFGTQFHPEKSQTLGLALITRFLSWKP